MSSPKQVSVNGHDAKDAAFRAATYLKELLPDTGMITIEEVQTDGEDGDWLITLGFPKRSAMGLSIESLTGGPREYKVFKVSRQSGEVLWMRMR